jgi:UDP-N-acetylmuramoyl-L-alanyl-D-glutamate--2,6-diaminopimelate ligase
LQHAGKKRGDDYIVVQDRREAIQRAIEMAREGDLVMLAGKGHEDYQIIGKTKHHFDDRETARNILEAIRA